MSVARIEEAFSLLDRGEAGPAADVLQQVLSEAPGYAPGYVLLARACETLHRWPEALTRWQDAALLMPTLDVSREGVLRATRVMAALQALDARTAARGGEATAEAPSEAESEAAEAESTPRTGYRRKPVTAPVSPGTTPEAAAPAVEAPIRGGIRLGSPPPPPEPTGTVPPPSRKTFGSPPAPPAVATPPAREADEEPAPRAPLPGAAFDAPPPPPRLFGGEEPAGEPALHASSPSPVDDALDLDALIEQLNTQGRIKARPDLDRIPTPDLEDDIEDMVSETLARIYATQGQYDEAARIYELLAAQQPQQADTFLQHAAEMRARAGEE